MLGTLLMFVVSACSGRAASVLLKVRRNTKDPDTCKHDPDFCLCGYGAAAPWTAEAVLSGAVGCAAVWGCETGVWLHSS